jgi:hypothetical protein
VEKYDLDKAIKDCEKRKLPDEVILYAVGSGRIKPKLGLIKKQKQAMNFIKGLDGFVGIYPQDVWHTLILFDTLNNCKRGRNLMNEKGIPLGKHIVPVLVKKELL